MTMKNIICLIAITTALYLSSCKRPSNHGNMINGALAPNITLPDSTGNPISMYEVGKNKIVILDFWASWCKPCLETHEALKQIDAEFKDAQIGNANGLIIYSVSLDDKPEAWKAALQKHHIPWQYQVNDKLAFGADAAKQYEVQQVPTVYIIDERHIIIGKDLTLKWLQYELRRRMGKA